MDLQNNPYRKDFPLLMEQNVVYLDSSATSQRPFSVLEAEKKFYECANANPLRGLYGLSMEATNQVEHARELVQNFIHANKACEIIFTRNATESLNLLAYSYGLSHLKAGDEIIVSIMEHHSNMLPWQMVAEQTGATIRYLECTDEGEITEEHLNAVFSDKTKLVAIAHISNVFGRINPVETIISMAHERGAVVVMDCAQSALHVPIDVQKLDVDFIVFSGHKMLAPMGIGVLYGKESLLKEMPPFLVGGEMIESVTIHGAKYAELPYKFEAGTGNAGGAVALGVAIAYIQSVGFDAIQEREHALTAFALEKMKEIEGVHMIGSKNADEHCGILTFTLDGVHPHDVSSILDFDQIAVRAGHHCAQPLMDYLKVSSTTRASIAFYNTQEDIEKFVESLSQIRRKMGYGQ
ncbi:MAG: SufS family cysteine desulfurase [Firmicutes bacterium]|uniref:Cysteine desulfurase n=1 Tax=Candidatus Scybalomonas excrementavium TaxID=2840943 RepID=A0A9D9HYI1_9FIRM|nr:SufS family cysteine desulfurase [Candidatus Scybalomonas excrementavium]